MLDNGYDVSLGKWSPWRGRFAWFPKQLQIRNSVNQGQRSDRAAESIGDSGTTGRTQRWA